MNTDVDDEHEDEFGIKQPSLVESLKRILDEYPDDGQILKELIQNAEDAPASTIKFLYDEQSYTVENLYCPSMAEFNQNPALIVYNDGIFTQRDWNTIGNLGVSKKKEDPIKVGKFGLGFKSVFHITDCPMIVSGNTFGIIDPNQKYFKDKSGRLLSGFKWTLSSEYVPTGHLAPFLDKFGFKGDELQGTIFRFPLRQNPSPLSDTIYTKDKVDSLLQGLTYNAYMKVLFLTNINKIEIYRHNKSLQYRSAVITCTEKAIEKVHFDGVTTCPTRAKFKQSLRNMTETGGAWACVTGLNIKTEKISNNGHSEKEDHSFVISHFCEKSEKASRLENLAEKQGNMPWVSCALDRNKKNYYPDGHVFVFLPLPMEGKSLSGLPVHVNGYFAISQNRRHLKWPSDEQLVKASSSKDTNDLEWNNQILSELLPKAYMNALKVHGSKGNICKYLPNPDDVDEKWKTLILEPFFSKLLHLELFHTTVKKEKMTVSLTDACLLVPGKNDNDEMMTIVSKVLTAADYGVVRVPDYVENAVRIYTGHQLLVATPDVIRQAMKTNPSSYKKRSDVDKMRLLEYILRDNCYTELKEIVLLPLENGQYAEFQEPKRKNIIYVADEDNPQSLLPGITDRFLRKCIPESMKMQLVGAGQQGHIQLRQLTPDGVIDLLPRVLYNNKDRCSNDELLTVYKHKTLITGEWYRKIWRYIVEKMHGEISKISHLHLILVEMNSNTHEWKFGCLKTRNAYVVRHHSTQQLSKKICIVLKAIGIIVIPNLMEEILRCPGILEGGDHMYKPTADGIVQAIYKLYENDTFFMTNAANLPKNIDNDSLDALRGYIAAKNQFPRRETWQKLCCELKDIGLKGRQDVKISDLAQAVERLAIHSPTLPQLVSQLKEVLQSYTTREKTQHLLLVGRIYEELERNSKECVTLKMELQNQNIEDWIWHGNGFVAVHRICIIKPDIDVKPYCYHLPPEMLQYKKWWTALGVAETINYFSVLHQIKLHHDSDQEKCDDTRDHDLNMVVNILNHFYTAGFDVRSGEIYLPVLINDKIRLVPPGECTICPSVPEQMNIKNEVDEEIKAVHPHLSEQVAERFGAYPLMKRLLNDADDFGSKGWGQQESLVRRLKNILRDYTDGFALPKELIQNADDAGATEVKLLWDERQNIHYNTKLLHEEMKHCQGPALWAYNNSVFTKNDLLNIKKLGGATKESDTVKIGRFGLGFNSVYNITDVPSFISEENLVIFDPHTTYLNIQGQPGILINLKKKPMIFHRAPDQIAPFQGVFGCELSLGNCKFNGTLFRFPLRTPYQAGKSEICEVVYKQQRMEELLNMMKDGLNIMLLFTQHVHKVSVYHLKEDASGPSQMVELFSAEKSFVLEKKHLPIHQITLNIETDERLMKASTVNVAAKLCFDTEQSFEAGYVSEMSLKTKEKCSKEKWLITSYNSNKRTTLTIAKELKTLPLGAVAIQLGDYFSPAPVEGRVFCHLPLPIESGLPFHINGCFAVASNRRFLEIRTQDDVANKRADWNNELCSDSVLQAFLYALEVLKESNTYENVLTLFPVREKTTDTSRRLCDAFYTHITRSSCAVFYDGEKWRSFNEVQFLSEELLDCELVDDVTDVINSYSKWGQVIVKCPSNIITELSLTNEKVKKKVLEKTWTVFSFIKDSFLPNVTKIKPTMRDRLLRFGLSLSESNPWVKELLSSTECFPVKGSSMLRKPADLVDPLGKCKMLYDEDDERFPPSEFLDDASRQALLNLKMIGDKLPINNVLERAKSIKRIEFEFGKKRMHFLLDHLQSIIPSGQLPKAWRNVQKQLVHIEFLLVKYRTADWNELPWKGEVFGEVFEKPVSLYSHKYEDLIGSIHPVTCSAIPSKVMHFLEIDEKTPSMVDVFKQLEHYQRLQGISSKNEIRIKRIYQFLNNNATGNEDVLEEHLMHILVHNIFMPVVHVALNFRMSTCLPYLAQVPRYFSNYKRLMEICDIRQQFTCKDYIEALARMKSAGETDIQNILGLIDSFSRHMESENKCSADFDEIIYLIDAANEWKSAKELSYNNMPWFDATAGQNFAHRNIVFRYAQRLGVRTSIESFLESNSRDLFGGISFGQKERLTTRLRRLVEGYPQETIIKELLQNADDAGATEIHLILDTNTYEANTIIGEQYRPIQGPALLVYNDKPFRKSDLIGIQNLGEGSKGIDPTATGQYGVGFNCVYSLTDTPQILSEGDEIGKVLCIFDPNCRYIPLANESSPGKLYDVNDKFASQFPDMFKPFNLTDLPIKGKTIFRFPLRTANMASTSNICSEAMTPANINKLLSLFEAESKNAMLFLKSIEKISISLKTEIMKEASVHYSISSKISDEHRKGKMAFNMEIRQMSECIYKFGDTTAINRQVDELHEVHLVDNKGKTETWMVSQVIGIGTNSFEESLKCAVNEKKLRLLPCGGVACRIDFDQSAINTTKSGKLYCFLPLPVDITPPVHINGHFALDETRRALWRDTNGGYRTDWNNLIMRHVAPVAHCLLVEYVQEMIVNDQTTRRNYEHQLSTMIPEKDDSNAYLHTFIESLYGHFKRRDSKLFITHYNRWFSISDLVDGKAFLDDLDNHTIRSSLIAVEFPLIKLVSPWLQDLLISLDYQVKTVKPQFVLDFFRQYRPSATKLSETPLGDVNNVISILQYCSNIRESFVSQLDGVCLCVTTADNLIPFKSVKPIFYSDYCDLLPPNECLFLSKRVCDLLSKYIDLSSCSVMKPFTLDDLAKLIHLSLPESQYKNAVVPSEDLMEGKWLKRLWEFVTEQISAIANLNMPYEQCRAEIGKVNCLNDWSLLPVITKSGKQLYPIKWAESVLNLHESDENPIKWHIEQFGLPTLDESFFGSVKAFKQISVFTVLNKMTCLLMYPGHVLSALTRHLDADNENEHSVHTATASWNCQQFQTILEYFASFFATGNACENDAACIRRLPIHETVRENRVPLQATGVYVIPRGMPYDGMLDSNIFANFLKENGVKAVNKMYRIIGCVVQTEVELYVSFILPVGFERYNTMERKAHLRYLRDHYICYKPAASQKYISRGSREIPLADFNREVNILINTLSKISFLPNQNGEEKTAKELYNPKIPVFRVMHSDNEFLHESFVESEWITFLEKIGLRSSVSQEELVTYAKTVECDGRAVILKAGPEHLYEESIDGTYSVTNKAKAIVENIYDRNDLSTQTIEELKKIKFIPVNKGIMSKLCPQTDPKYLISFSGSVTSINMPLCWSCMDVLPVWATPKNTDIKSRFGVYENPPQSMISLHCKNVCQHLADSNKHEVCSRYSKEIEEMMNNIYCRLEGYENLEELNDVPCVFVSSGRNYFVYPRQVVINFREEDQIEPYLLRRPVYCSHLESMLEKIGVSKNVTMQHYANVLADIEKLYGDKRLNDNDFSKAVQASLKFYNLIGLEHNNNSRNEDTKKDYTLLIRGKTLRKSSQIYYIDGYRYKGRMKEIKENLLMERHRHDDEPVIIIKPWEKEILTRISFLQPISTLLIEELSESCKVNVYSASTQPFITIQQNLLDPNVHEAIHRVIRHFAKPQEAKNITLDEVSTYYQQIQIFECQQLETVLKCRGKVITESKENVDNFNTVDSLAVGCIRFYFTHIEEAPRYAATRRMKNIANIFSNQYATKYIGSFDDLDGFRECMYAIIFAGPETGLLEILKRWHIDMSDEFNDDDVLPSAGSYIPVADHHLLSNRFASFHTGDYVGYKIHDDILDNENGDSGAVYIYGIIIERVQNEENTSSGEVPRRLDHCYKVNIGDRKVEIYGYELYKFLRYDDEEKDLIVPDELDMSPIDTEKELEQLLKTAWTLDPSERNKIILRLLANYSDNDAILDCIKKQNKQEEENYKRRVSSQEPGSNFVDDRNFDIDLATSYLKARQDQHRNDRERCLRALQNNSKRCGRSRRSTFVPGMMSKGRNPQPIEARKWLQQAEITLKTVPNDVSGGFHFMTIFKCHLTCEQALIAMVHARDSLQYGHHESKPNLVRLTGKIDDCSGEVQRLAAKLQCDICHDRTRLFYPSRFGGRPTEIPHTAFSETESTEAQLIAAELVKLAKEYVVNAI
ncbi:sacsin-like [Tubulanus polymorphus]|uniref:sacsin-like n=1 Tax=Tubulanus polymorphus TaxID=672921 RepID=UPI003DA24F72